MYLKGSDLDLYGSLWVVTRAGTVNNRWIYTVAIWV